MTRIDISLSQIFYINLIFFLTLLSFFLKHTILHKVKKTQSIKILMNLIICYINYDKIYTIHNT